MKDLDTVLAEVNAAFDAFLAGPTQVPATQQNHVLHALGQITMATDQFERGEIPEPEFVARLTDQLAIFQEFVPEPFHVQEM